MLEKIKSNYTNSVKKINEAILIPRISCLSKVQILRKSLLRQVIRYLLNKMFLKILIKMTLHMKHFITVSFILLMKRHSAIV